MTKFKVSLCLTVCALFVANFAAADSPDPIIVAAYTQEKTLIRGYDAAGAPLFEIGLPVNDVTRIISANWSATSSFAIYSKPAKSPGKVTILNSDSSVAGSLTLPDEPINTLFTADFNNNGAADLVAVIHNGTKAKALIFYDPGISSSSPAAFPLAAQALYYSPALAGKTAVGIFAYNPQGGVAAAKKKNKRAAKKRKGKNKKGKNKKKPNNKKSSGVVNLLDTAGSLIQSLNIGKSADGQIYPFSNDGNPGFAIRSGAKIKLFNNFGAPLGDFGVPVDAPISFGDFHNSGLTEEILIPSGSELQIYNLSSGAVSQFPLSGLPDQGEALQAEIEKLTKELTDAFRRNASLAEITRIRDRIIELQSQKGNLTSIADIGAPLTRLFTGGAGSIEGVCDVVFENPNDGYGGFLIKNGDFTGKIVVLTPGGRQYYDGELVKFKSYKVMQKLKDSGYGNPDSHGMRKHFRGSGTVTSLGKFIFRAKLKPSLFASTSEYHCWFIKKPASRID